MTREERAERRGVRKVEIASSGKIREERETDVTL